MNYPKELTEDSVKEANNVLKSHSSNRGDLPNLRISVVVDKATLIREVSIVFHISVTVRFNEKMKQAIPINVQNLRDLIDLSKDILKLKL
ncbi:fatty acyl-CoA reductase wat-like [Vespula squamosa]|uniref:Fatty acyl-CoA reductase wat-like n=1 Tax=Vespula squamosa TaxID=30214 RepID=A0ABD2C954_VESSQ